LFASPGFAFPSSGFPNQDGYLDPTVEQLKR